MAARGRGDAAARELRAQSQTGAGFQIPGITETVRGAQETRPGKSKRRSHVKAFVPPLHVRGTRPQLSEVSLDLCLSQETMVTRAGLCGSSSHGRRATRPSRRPRPPADDRQQPPATPAPESFMVRVSTDSKPL